MKIEKVAEVLYGMDKELTLHEKQIRTYISLCNLCEEKCNKLDESHSKLKVFVIIEAILIAALAVKDIFI